MASMLYKHYYNNNNKDLLDGQTAAELSTTPTRPTSARLLVGIVELFFGKKYKMAMKQQIKSVAQTSEKVKTVRKVSLTENLDT